MSAEPSNDENLPLRGIRVVEFSQTVMGPCAGMLLADLGADVLKIESPPMGDPTRELKGFASGMFVSYNRNKRSVVIDCKQPEGQAVLHDLLRTADVFIENFAPGTVDRLGCGYKTVAALNPRLVYLSLKGFLSGPYENRAALDEVVQFMGGLAYMTGPLGRPLRAGASVTDIMGALFGVFAVVSALYERQASGKGRHIRSSLFESVTFMMGQFMAGIKRQGREMKPMPDRDQSWPVYDIFNSADGEIVFVSVTSEKSWARFVAAFDLPFAADDARLATLPLLMAARSWTLPVITARMKDLPQAEIARRCEAAGCGWAPASRPSQLWDDPQLRAGHMLTVRIPGYREEGGAQPASEVDLPGLPLELDGQMPGLRNQPPLFAEHTREVLAGLLGEEAYARLLQKKIVAEG